MIEARGGAIVDEKAGTGNRNGGGDLDSSTKHGNRGVRKEVEGAWAEIASTEDRDTEAEFSESLKFDFCALRSDIGKGAWRHEATCVQDVAALSELLLVRSEV